MSELEFRITIIRILAGVEKKNIEFLYAEIKQVKSSQDEIRNAITKIQSQMYAKMARVGKAQQQISYIEDRSMENK